MKAPNIRVGGALHGGIRPGAGRPKGSPNRVLTLRERAARHGGDMLDVLVSVASDDAQSGIERVLAAWAVIDLAGGTQNGT